MRNKIKATTISIIFILIALTWVSKNQRWRGDDWTDIIQSDAKGYYAYLPGLFVYQDLNFGFFDTTKNVKYYDYRSYANGKVINKYYCGTAIAQIPFFLIAHSYCAITNTKMNGFTKPYFISVNIAAIFYVLFGLLYINKTLKYYKIREWPRALILLATIFGTNLYFYTVGEPGMSHVFSFAFVAMFLYHSKSYFLNYQNKHILLTALALGMITLIRPINGLVVFTLPFIAGDFTTLSKATRILFRKTGMLILGVLVFFAVISIQLIIYKISTGVFLIYTYGQEGFKFLSPHFIDMLFSYKKGLFVYTPMYLLSFTGLIYLWKTSRFAVLSWLGFFVLITYILSSWWMWFYGGSFSSRVYVEFIPFFMVLLALPFRNINRKGWKITYSTIILLLIIVCQIMSYQYRYTMIHWGSMTKEMYWDVFLRIDKLL